LDIASPFEYMFVRNIDDYFVLLVKKKKRKARRSV
jgi:hypothetical protein